MRARTKRFGAGAAVTVAIVATVLATVVQAPPAFAASLTVNTAADIAPNGSGTFPTDGRCSLRAAIIAAQSNSNAHDVDCSTGAPVANVLDTIQIDPSLAGSTFTLTHTVAGVVQPFATISGPTNPMKIIGPTTDAADFTISGGNAVRPFIVGVLNVEPGVLTLANLTVRGGNATAPAGSPAVDGQGGALYAGANSQLTLDNAVFTANSASKGGAIYAESPTITNNGGAYTNNSASDDGGAIYLNSGPSILNGYALLLASNSAADKGGAIATNPGNVNPLVHLERSLLRNNTTSTASNGGVLYVEPVGAPAAVTFELYDSTVYANSSLFFSTATSQKFDFKRNTIKDSGNLWGGTGGGDISNSIVTGANTCTYSINVVNFTGQRNLMDPYTGPGDCGLTRFGPLGAVTNMAATLAQNGGPEVQQTFAIFEGSNAIDNGLAAHCGTIDARSVARGLDGNGIPDNPQVGDCDIGAYEYAKYVVNFVTGTSSANEGVGTKDVQVKLKILDPGSSPTPAPVFVPVANQATSTATITHDFTLAGGGVTFPAGSVDGAVADLQVDLIQDDVAELFGEEAHLDLAASVAGVAIAEPNSHTLSIQDDDQAGVVVDDGGDGTTLAEATPLAGEGIVVKLQSRPDRQLLDPAAPGDPASYGPPADVVMHVAVDRDCTVLWNGEVATVGDPFDVTIANADWDTGETLIARPVDDAYDEDLRDEAVEHVCEVRYSFDSLDPIYDVTQDAYEIDIADDDVAGVNLVRVGGPSPLRENSPDAATYDVSLDSAPDPGKPIPAEPRSATTVTLSVPAGCDLGNGSGQPMDLTFTEANFAAAQSVTLTPAENAVVELARTCAITSSVASGDPIIADLSQPPTFAGTPPTASEQVQDYDPPNGNDDDPPFAIVATDGSDGVAVGEGASATPDGVSIVLLRAPKGDDVTFTLSAADDPIIAGPQVALATSGDAPASSVSVTFTPANWDTPQTIDVLAIDDDHDEDDTHPWTLQATMASTAPGFDDPALRRFVVDGIELAGPADVDVAIADDDTSALDIRDTGAGTGVVEGGASDTVDVRLATHPYSPVDVKITADAQCTVNGSSSATVTVAPADWDRAHEVAVAAVDDPALEGPHSCQLSFDALSDDSRYDQLDPLTASVDVADDDVPGVDVTTSGGVAVSEDGTTDAFELVLRAQPSADVTVDLAGDQTDTVASITFTPATWDVPRTVVVAAIDDDIDEDDPHDGSVAMSVTSAAVGYGSAPIFTVDAIETEVVSVQVGDDDTAGVAASTTALTLLEGGIDDSYTLRLLSEPIADVTVTPAAAGLCTVSGAITFTAADWDVAQAIDVTPGDDDIDGARTCTITHAVASSDPRYASLGVADAAGAVVDDDTAGVAASKTDLVLEEGGAADTYSMALTSEPVADVTLTPSASGLCTASGPITFGPADWDVPQTVTVTPGDDATVGPATCTITHTSTSEDPRYDGLAIADAAGAVADDDTPPNGPPTTGTLSVLAARGATKTFNLPGSDPDEDPLTYVVTSPPAIGSLVCDDAGACGYVAPVGASGDASFTYTVSDGIAPPVPGSVTLTVGMPRLSVGDASVTEAESGATGVFVPMTLSSPVSSDVVIDFYTVHGSTTNADYQRIGSASSPARLRIPAGMTWNTAGIPVFSDATTEPDETFTVHIVSVSSVDPVAIGDGLGEVTIFDVLGPGDDPVLSVQSAMVWEGDVGKQRGQFVLRLSRPTAVPVSVTVFTVDGSATAGSDYAAVLPRTVTIPAGKQSAIIDVSIFGDFAIEGHQTFELRAVPAPGAPVIQGDVGGMMFVLDDDA